jgi:hypothetical protein
MLEREVTPGKGGFHNVSVLRQSGVGQNRQSSVFSQSIARLQQASAAAVSALMKVMLDGNSPASSRVRAADCILTHAARAIELEDVEVRVTELEERQKPACLHGRADNVTRKLLSRLDKLEAKVPPNHLGACRTVMDCVLRSLSVDELRVIRDAMKNQHAGRELTAVQLATAELYGHRIDVECRRAGFTSFANFRECYDEAKRAERARG